MATFEELMQAVRDRNAAKAAALIADAPELAERRPAQGPSPLLMAAYVQATDCVTHLRAYATCDLFEATALGDEEAVAQALRADPEAIGGTSGDGWTALHLAAFFGRTEIARVLLAAGAAIDAVSKGPEANRPLHAALAGAGMPEMVMLLLESGADVRALGASDITPLHVAASRGSNAFVDALLTRGADPQAVMTDGRTPADLAAERGHPVLAERLRALR